MKAAMRSAAIGLFCSFFALPHIGFCAHENLSSPSIHSRLAEKSLISAIAMAGNRLVVVGQRGHILYSDDIGKTWRQAEVPVSSDLVAVQFPNAQFGWAVGHDGVVLATTDAGQHWVKQLDGLQVAEICRHYYKDTAKDIQGAEIRGEIDRLVADGPDKPFLDVHFESPTSGYVVGAFNLILNTSDGGKTWVPLYDRVENPKRLHLYSINSVAGNLLVTGEQGLILKWEAASNQFKRLPIDYTGTLFGSVQAGGSILVFGLRGNAYRSDDGGRRWEKLNTGLRASIVAGTTDSNGEAYLVSQAGEIVAFNDEGKTFRLIDGSRAPTSAALAVKPGHLIAVGLRGIRQAPLAR